MLQNIQKKVGVSKLYLLQLADFSLRLVMLITAVAMYVLAKVNGNSTRSEPFGSASSETAMVSNVIWGIFWVIMVIEMLVIIFPTKYNTIGAKKRLKENFVPTEEKVPKLTSFWRMFWMVNAWMAINLTFFILYWTKVIDGGVIFLLSLTFHVFDLFCVLFYCPLRQWFMKNRCCTDCRIHNWGFIMICTPLIAIPHWYTWSLLAMAFYILAVWEITLWRHPERFAVNTNARLQCANCKDQPCRNRNRLARESEHRRIKEQKAQRVCAGTKDCSSCADCTSCSEAK